jgi:hypothetical protein
MLIKLAAEWRKAAQELRQHPSPSQEQPPSQKLQAQHPASHPKREGRQPWQGQLPTKTLGRALHKRHCWLTNRKNIPTTIARAIRIPTTSEIIGCRLGLSPFDPAPFCAAPRPSQNGRLPIDRYLAIRRVASACIAGKVATLHLPTHPAIKRSKAAPQTPVSSVPFKRRPRSAQDSNRSNHQQPEWKHPQARNRLQSQSRQQQPLPAQHHE